MSTVGTLLDIIARRSLKFTSEPLPNVGATQVIVRFALDDGGQIDSHIFVDDLTGAIAVMTYLIGYSVARGDTASTLDLINKINYRTGLWGHFQLDEEKGLIRLVSYLPYLSPEKEFDNISEYIDRHWRVCRYVLAKIPAMLRGTLLMEDVLMSV